MKAGIREPFEKAVTEIQAFLEGARMPGGPQPGWDTEDQESERQRLLRVGGGIWGAQGGAREERSWEELAFP